MTTLANVLEDYADLGFWLKEEFGTATILYFKDNPIPVGYFNQIKVSQETIWQACQEYLDGLKGGKK